ncbi:MAG: hydroxymethylbilane synthase [Actinobacteria bacterium]|nr:hydroxymethylbilane synthase [Actinomycetota bacterium]
MRLATRGSELARWQAERIEALLDVPCELVIVSTLGDRRRDVPIHTIGGTAAFAKEVQEALLDGRADLAVHSAKDLPAATPERLVLAAVPERADSRDALVGATLAGLATGACVGTGSVRRRAQLGALRPDLTFGELRGNIPTRIERAEAFDAIVVAYAALLRLGLAHRATDILDPSQLLPQVGQGALAVECRDDDARVRGLLVRIDDGDARRTVEAERSFLAELGGGCNLPCGAHATVDSHGRLVLRVLLASLDGRVLLRTEGRGDNARELGVDVARRLLDDCGGRLLLADVA